MGVFTFIHSPQATGIIEVCREGPVLRGQECQPCIAGFPDTSLVDDVAPLAYAAQE